MKRFLWATAIALALFGCISKNRYQVDTLPNTTTDLSLEYGHIMNESEIRTLALSLPERFNNKMTKFSQRSIKSVIPLNVVCETKSDLNNKLCSQSLLDQTYIVNYQDNAGFAIICADNRTEQVLAYSEKGNIQSGVITKSGIYSNDGNYTINDILELIPYYYDYLSKYVIPYPEIGPAEDSTDASGYYYCCPNAYYTEWYNLEGSEIHTSSSWGQLSPYNDYCLYLDGNLNAQAGKVGCTAIAVGQLMAWFNSPGTFVSSWVSPRDTIQTVWPYNCSASNSTSRRLADFLYNISSIMNTDYSTGGVDNPEEMIPIVLNRFGYYMGTATDYSYYAVSSSINTYHGPVIATARHNYMEGHTWLIAGYKSMTRKFIVDWDVYDSNSQFKGRWSSIRESDTQYARYVYCNWGWDGDYDGYYASGLFKPGNKNYNTQQRIITGIRPR